MHRIEAYNLLSEWTKTRSLYEHCLCVAFVMTSVFPEYNDKQNTRSEWFLAGLLHDADWEKSPADHPNTIVESLNERGLEEVAHAISAHCTEWKVQHRSAMSRCLLAFDEITGFIVAVSRVYGGIDKISTNQVMKKFRKAKFAASVSRAEIRAGAELLSTTVEHIVDLALGALEKQWQEIQSLADEYSHVTVKG